MVAQDCNSSTQKAKAGELSQVSGQPAFYNKFQAGQGYSDTCRTLPEKKRIELLSMPFFCLKYYTVCEQKEDGKTRLTTYSCRK